MGILGGGGILGGDGVGSRFSYRQEVLQVTHRRSAWPG